MPLLTDISIAGYKSIKLVEKLPLGPLNVIVGANGSGKSNFISCFEMLSAIVEGRLKRYVKTAGGANVLLHHGAKTTPEMSFTFNERGGTNGYGIGLQVTDTDGLVPVDEWGSFWDETWHSKPLRKQIQSGDTEAGISRPNPTGIPHWVSKNLRGWRKYHFHDTGPRSALRQTADVDDNRQLAADGGNLAPFLRLLREKNSPEFAAIMHATQRVAPFIDELILEPLAMTPEKMRLEWRHVDGDGHFGVSALSDGTLRFLALATTLLQPSPPRVIVIDEPELGLHPVAIRMIGALMRSVSTSTQLVVSTQSPLLLDEFQPEDVIVADLVDGATTLTRLDPVALAQWLEEYSLGELWEKNELGGRPR